MNGCFNWHCSCCFNYSNFFCWESYRKSTRVMQNVCKLFVFAYKTIFWNTLNCQLYSVKRIFCSRYSASTKFMECVLSVPRLVLTCWCFTHYWVAPASWKLVLITYSGTCSCTDVPTLFTICLWRWVHGYRHYNIPLN